ncbi:MAG: hypothetical protein GX848_05660 [Clostridiales bacterium]|nr:hypothetical protein [Clostridiales bacterium]
MRKSILRQSLTAITTVLYSLPFLLYMSFLFALDIRITAFIYIILTFLSFLLKTAVITSQVFALLPILYIFTQHGSFLGLISILIGTMAFFILYNLPINKYINAYIAAGVTLMLAFCATALFTTDYFGIGATGSTVFEILRSYRYLGFHANWRGVLYGTITLVIMITYPRAFKTLKSRLPAPAVALGIPYILNLFLNPNSATTYINEPVTIYNGLPSFSPSSAAGILYAFLGGLAFAVLLQIYKDKDSGLFYGAPKLHAISYEKKDFNLYSVCLYAFLMLAAVFLLKPVFTRIPVHSLAVVPIVAAWQSVEWKNIGKAFIHGFIPWLLVVSTFGLILIFNAVFSILLAFLLSVFYSEVLVWQKK